MIVDVAIPFISRGSREQGDVGGAIGSSNVSQSLSSHGGAGNKEGFKKISSTDGEVAIPFISRGSRELEEETCIICNDKFCRNPFHLTGEQGTWKEIEELTDFDVLSQSLSSHGGAGNHQLVVVGAPISARSQSLSSHGGAGNVAGCRELAYWKK